MIFVDISQNVTDKLHSLLNEYKGVRASVSGITLCQMQFSSVTLLNLLQIRIIISFSIIDDCQERVWRLQQLGYKPMNTDCSDIGEVTMAMLDGSLNYLQGAELLVRMRDELGVYANDPDFVAFIAVLSEIEYLRDRQGCFNWLLLKSEENQERIKASIRWAQEISLDNCKSLANRYGGDK